MWCVCGEETFLKPVVLFVRNKPLKLIIEWSCFSRTFFYDFFIWFYSKHKHKIIVFLDFEVASSLCVTDDVDLFCIRFCSVVLSVCVFAFVCFACLTHCLSLTVNFLSGLCSFFCVCLNDFEIVAKWVQMPSTSSSSWCSLPTFLSTNNNSHYIFKSFFTRHTIGTTKTIESIYTERVWLIVQ